MALSKKITELVAKSVPADHDLFVIVDMYASPVETKKTTLAQLAAVLGGLPSGGTSADYLRGDVAWATLNQAVVAGLTTAGSPSFVNETLTGGILNFYDATYNHNWKISRTVGGDTTTFLDFDLTPSAVTDDFYIRFCRATNTSGVARIYFHKGDGTSTSYLQIDLKTGDVTSAGIIKGGYIQPTTNFKSVDGTVGVTGSFPDYDGTTRHFKNGLYVG